MLVAAFVCLIAVTLAQRPAPCTTPPQWEANLYDYNQEAKFAVQGRLSYDSTYHRERLVEEVEQGTQDDYFDTLALFDSKVEFIYNFKTRNCSRQEITRPWRDFGIQPDATSYGEAYIGSSAFPGTGVLITIWLVQMHIFVHIFMLIIRMDFVSNDSLGLATSLFHLKIRSITYQHGHIAAVFPCHAQHQMQNTVLDICHSMMSLLVSAIQIDSFQDVNV
jgi:hypothetical protein